MVMEMVMENVGEDVTLSDNLIKSRILMMSHKGVYAPTKSHVATLSSARMLDDNYGDQKIK